MHASAKEHNLNWIPINFILGIEETQFLTGRVFQGFTFINV